MAHKYTSIQKKKLNSKNIPLIVILFYLFKYKYYNLRQQKLLLWLIDWCLTPTLAVFQLYRSVFYIGNPYWFPMLDTVR